jgi:hypothetical protein
MCNITSYDYLCTVALVCAMKAYGRMKVYLYNFLIFAVGGGIMWSLSSPGCLTMGERAPRNH